MGGEGDTRKKKLLHRGKLNIVSFLESLPKTTHDLNSFTLDVTVSTETTIIFSLTGLFREREDSGKLKPIRHFSRFFVIMKGEDQGWNIVNEVFYITSPTNLQLKVGESSFELFDPKGHDRIGGHYFHTLCPSFRMSITKIKTSYNANV